MTNISFRSHDVDGATLQIDGTKHYADFQIAQDGRFSIFEAKEADLIDLRDQLSAALVDEDAPQATVPDVASPANTEASGDARADWNTLAIHNASHLGLPIRFRHAKGGDGPITERTIKNVEPVKTSKGWVVFGDDYDRGEERQFRIEWIKGYVAIKD